jgi:hypothetical protein
MMKRLALAARLLLGAALLAGVTTTPARAQGARVSRNRVLEPNVHAPELYSPELEVRLTLVNLPGAADRRSYWEASYEVYFVPETEYQRAVAQVAMKGLDLDPSHFAVKTLLTSGKFKKTRLADLPARTYVQHRVPFKVKVRDGARTKFARLMTSYTSKIFDASLGKTFYRSSAFFTYPFDDHPQDAKRAVPRTTIYTNFFVTPDGKLFYSQWPRAGDSTVW